MKRASRSGDPAPNLRGRRQAATAPRDLPAREPTRLAALAQRAAPVLWHLAAIATFWRLQFRALFDIDLWFHLAAGRLIWEQRAVPSTDSWSFTAGGLPWQNHEWLADVLFYGWAKLFGVESLIFWQWLIVGVAYVLLFRLCRRISGSWALAYVLSSLALAVGTAFYDIRPQLWTVLLFVVLLGLAGWRDRPPLALPLLFLPWINLHGGAIFGLMVAGVALAAWAIAGETPPAAGTDGRARRAGLAAGLWLASCAVALVNPFGWRALAYPFRLALGSHSASRTLLAEWLPPFAPGDLYSPLYAPAIGVFALAVVALLATGWRRDRRHALTAAGVGLLTLAMSLSSRRFVPLFAIATAVAVAQGFAAVHAAWRSRPARVAAAVPRPALAAALPAALLAVSAWQLAPYPLGTDAFDPLTFTSKLPIDSLTFMEVNGLRGDLFAFYQWGGYVDWRSAGRLRVHFDTRSETVFPDAVMRAHAAVAQLAPDAERVVEESSARWVLWPTSEAAYRGLLQRLEQSGRWRRIYRDGVSVLLERVDGAPQRVWQPTPDSAYHSWAIARQAIDAQRLDVAVPELERALAQSPRLWPACEDLAVAHSLRSEISATRATVERCKRIFPDLHISTEALLARVRQAGGSRLSAIR